VYRHCAHAGHHGTSPLLARLLDLNEEGNKNRRFVVLIRVLDLEGLSPPNCFLAHLHLLNRHEGAHGMGSANQAMMKRSKVYGTAIALSPPSTTGPRITKQGFLSWAGGT